MLAARIRRRQTHLIFFIRSTDEIGSEKVTSALASSPRPFYSIRQALYRLPYACLMSDTSLAARFEGYRATLLSHACRILGERAEAEDAVQDAYLRWHTIAAKNLVKDERAYLRTTVRRLCVDRLRSARARHEAYVGAWLPESLAACSDSDPAVIAAFAEDVSFALLLALERLSSLERAAFLLHDVMGVSFSEIARTLLRSEGAVKQLASRARTRIRKPRHGVTRSAAVLRLCDALAAAIRDHDIDALQRLIA